MNKRLLMGLVVVMVLVICLPAQAVMLRYTPAVGSVNQQTAQLAGTMQTTIVAMGQTMTGKMAGNMSYTEKALSRTGDITRVQTDMTGGTMTINFNGQAQEVTMPTGKVVADMDSLGRTVKLVEAKFGDDDTQQMFGGMGADNFPSLSQFGAFPECDVNVNDTWSGTLKIPAGPNMPAMDISFTSTLLGLDEINGRKCAIFKTKFSGPMEIDLSQIAAAQGAQGSISGTLKGEIIRQYDYEKSVFIADNGSINMDMTMTMAGAPAGAIKTKMDMTIKTTLVK